MISRKVARVVQVGLLAVAICIVIMVSITVVRSISQNISDDRTDTSEQSLLTVDDGSAVKMLVRGEIVADEDFRYYEIKIAPSQRQLSIYQGYEGDLIQQINLDNNHSSYNEFVHALAILGLASGRESDGNSIGVCAGGEKYQFQIIEDEAPIKTLWTSTCSSADGTLKGGYKSYSELFISQIPDGQSIIRDIW